MAAVQFAVAPSFNHLVLADDADIGGVVQAVLKARDKSEHYDNVFRALAQRWQTVGELRKLTDHDWRQQTDLPAILGIYLKYAVRQSVRPATPLPLTEDERLRELQLQFNYGRPFNMSEYEENLQMLGSMGFGRIDALEALCITGHKGVEAALELLVESHPIVRKKRRLQAVQQQGRMASGYVLDMEGPEGEERSSKGGASSQLEAQNYEHQQQLAKSQYQLQQQQQQLTLLQSQLKASHELITKERGLRTKLEVQVKALSDKETYKEFLRGLISDDKITLKQTEKLNLYREQLKLSFSQHLEILTELGLTKEQFENLKDFTVKRENECVVCLERVKTHAVKPCFHLCLCEDCGLELFAKPAPKCPMCSKRGSKIVRIYT